MTNVFQPKTVQVPGILSDTALQEQLKVYADQQKTQLNAAPAPNSAVEFADKISREYMSQPKLTTPVRQKQNLAIETRSNILKSGADALPEGDTAAGMVTRNLLLGPVIGNFGEGSIGDKLGTLTPEEQQDAAEKQYDDAVEREKAIKAKEGVRDQLRSITDEQAAEMGMPTAPGGFTDEEKAKLEGQDDEAVKAGGTKTAEKKAALTDKSKQPTQEWWLSAIRTGFKGFTNVGMDALRAGPIMWEMTLGRLANEGAMERSDMRAWVDTVDATLDKLMPPDKAYAKDFTTKLAAGGGSFAAFMLGGVISRVAGLPANSATAILGAAGGASSTFQEAEQFNATSLQKYLSFAAGGLLGLTEAIPIDRMFTRADQATGGLVQRLLANTAASSMQEFIQEFGQAVGGDVVAKMLYDEQRKFDVAEWAKQGLVGAITGGLGGTAATILRESGVTPVQPTGEVVEDAQREEAAVAVIDALQTQFDQTFDEPAGSDIGISAEEMADAVLKGELVPSAPDVDGNVYVKPEDLVVLEGEEVGPDALAKVAPAEQRTVTTRGGTIPVREDGRMEIAHYSKKQLEEIDPAQRGTGPLKGKERQRLGSRKGTFVPLDAVANEQDIFKAGGVPAVTYKGKVYTGPSHADAMAEVVEANGETAKREIDADPEKYLGYQTPSDPNVVDRSYFGVGELQPLKKNDYRKRSDPYHGEGLGPMKHVVSVDPETMYNIVEDPLNLRAQLDPDAAGPERVTRYERLIKDAGFAGAYFPESPHGQVAMLFDKAKPERVDNTNYGMPASEVAKPENFQKPTAKTFTEKGGWAVLTATQEAQGDANSPANIEANEKLRKDLKRKGIVFDEVGGTYQGVDQGPSFLVYAPEAKALELGKKYKQESVLTRRGLEYVDGRLVPAVPSETVVGAKARERDFFSTLPSGETFSIGLDFDADTGLFAQALPNGDDTNRISTRYPQQKGSTENPIAERLAIDIPAMQANPKAFEANAQLIARYLNSPLDAKGKSAEEIVEAFKEHVKDNLRWLYKQVAPEIREQTKKWYDGARKIVDKWEKRYQLPDHAVSGVLAALSPQKDWYQNVSLAERVLDIVSFRSGESWSPKMEKTAAKIFGKDAYAADLDKIRGKTLEQIDPEELALQAMWVRIYDEANNDRAFREVASTGEFVGEPKGNVAWGSNVEIGKAIAVIRDPSYANVSARMGDKHKVRNFYNNILAPQAPKGDVTIDTHAVAAALMRPLSGSSTEVFHNFGSSPMKAKQPADWDGAAKSAGVSGASGTYGVYADAYRELASELGILPRELQSITWEAVRGLFPAKFKNAKNTAAIDAIWRSYREGEISADEAREQTSGAAGGINPPSWYRPGAGLDVAGEQTSYARDIPVSSVPGPLTRGAAGSGAGERAAGAVPERIGEELYASTSASRGPYKAEQVRPDTGIATPAGQQSATENADVSLSKIVRNLSKTMDLTLRQGRISMSSRDSFGNKQEVMGQYSRGADVARVRTMSDLSTIVHEAGHKLYFGASDPLKQFIMSSEADLMKVGTDLYGGDTNTMPKSTHIAEGFAEFFRVYTLNRKFAANKYGTLTTAFEALLDKHDKKLKTGLDIVGQQFNAWLQMPSSQMVANMIVTGKQDATINAAIKELREVGFQTWFHEVARKAVEESVNRYAGLDSLINQTLNIGQKNKGKAIDLKRAEDPRALIRLAQNTGARAHVQLTDGVMGYRSVTNETRGLREALLRYHGKTAEANLGAIDPVRQKDFAAYLVALRGADEYRRFSEGKIKRPPVAATLGDLKLTIDEMDAKYGTDFSEAAAIAHEYGMGLWKKAFDAGLMKQETYDDGLDRQFYVPLQRDMSDKKSTFGEGPLTGGQKLVKHFSGSDRDIIDPMDMLMHKTFALEQIIARNDVMKTLASLADRTGKAGAMVERVPAQQLIGSQFSVAEIARQLTKDENLTEADAVDLMTLLEASIKDDKTLALFRQQQAATLGENIVFFWENGRLAALQLADGDLGADVVNVVNGLGRENLPLFADLIAASSSAFRSAITLWPDFLVVNFIRDQMSAFILTNVGYKPFWTGLKGVGDEVRQKQWSKQYNAAMGAMGGMNVASLHNARIDRDIGSMRGKNYIVKAVTAESGMLGAIKGFGRIMELTETGSRLGIFRSAYERAKADGLNDWDASIEASYTATDYMNFGLNGSRMLLARRTIPFLNANLQGLYKLMRALGGDEVRQRKGLQFALSAYFKNINNLDLSRTEKQALQTGRAAWVKMAALGLISAALHFLYEDDPDYQEAGEYMRTTGWVIPVGDGQVWYIPKPFQLALLANFTERALEYATGDETAKARFLRGFAMVMTPPTAPPAIQSVVEYAANKDFFTGQEIVPSYMQALQPELQFNNYTTAFAKNIAEITGWSPMVVDHFMSSLGASAYRDLTTMYGAATDPGRAEMDATDAPVLRRFVRDIRKGSSSSQDFWEQASTLDGSLRRAEVSYRRYLESGNETGAEEYLQTLDEDDRAYALLNAHFKADEKRLNPFYRTRQINTIVSAIRRELVTVEGPDDTLVKASGETIKLSRREKNEMDTALSEYARREMRNTLIAMGAPGWRGKKRLDTDTTLNLIEAIEPRMREELDRRLTKAKVYDGAVVEEYWPEVKDRLLSDHENAFLSDVTAIAKVSR